MMLNHPLPQRDTISLAGTWQIRHDREAAWRPVAVPGCWEQCGMSKSDAGPFWYRTTIAVPAGWAGRRVWLRFGAVSYHCEVFVNGTPVGQHTGLWDAFSVEITGAMSPGSPAELAVRVEKPAGLTAGPDSARLPGRFPLRETLAGFLPYVWGSIFGGLWQDVTLVATGQIVFEDVHIRGAADGRVQITLSTSAPADVTLELRDPDGGMVTVKSAKSAKFRDKDSTFASSAFFAVEYRARFEMAVQHPQPWSPPAPALYTARLAIADGDERIVRFGLRSLRADGSTLLLNGEPIYPRMALSWGWYPEALHSNPGPDRVRADFARLRQLGYNGVKLCLWFPPQYYFGLADELGMLLWVELPMWIPQPSALFRAQTPIEYDRLMRLARGHPSAIIYTLGCELSRAADAELLAPLFALVKQHAGDALVRDNSGSGEAYGGLLNEYAEFYDHHFYSDLQHLRGLLDYFAPRGRAPQPWLFGEFCDYDTFRDPERLRRGGWGMGDGGWASERTPIPIPHSPSPAPWWMSDDPAVNPQGARWQMDVPHHERRLRANGMLERGAELERISEQQGLWHRKYTFELVRLYREISGYVVTGEADTPVSTAGMWDHADRLKFDPGAFRGSNADLVLLASWDRRRDWVAGGDRAAPWDTWSYAAGATVRPHLIASHYGRARGPARLRWSVGFPGEAPFAQGEAETPLALIPGDLRELAVAEFAVPHVAAPRQALLEAHATIGGEQAHNSWTLWFFPRSAWANVRNVALYDPIGRLSDLPEIAPHILTAKDAKSAKILENYSFAPFAVPQSSVIIATVWTPELHQLVEGGGRTIVLLSGAGRPGPLPVRAMPFWREALRLAEPHPAWSDFPLDDALATQLYGCATDHALDLREYAGEWRPILRRLDTRTAEVYEYAVELPIGRGSAIVSTLRFEGGQGNQPLEISRNTAAAYLLWCWVRALSESDQS